MYWHFSCIQARLLHCSQWALSNDTPIYLRAMMKSKKWRTESRESGQDSSRHRCTTLMKPQDRRNRRTQGCICIRSIGDRDALSRPQCPLVPNAPPSCHPQGSNVTLLHADLRRRTMSRIVYRLLLFVFSERKHPLPVSVHWVKTRVQNMKTNLLRLHRALTHE